MFICAILNTNIIKVIYEYASNETFKNDMMSTYSNFNFTSCFFEVMIDTLKNYEWNFDYIIIWATNIFQISLPFLAIFGYMNNKYFYKSDKNKFKMFAKKESFKMSVSIFSAYLFFFILIIIICKGRLSTYITREFLIDIFGEKFYFNHTYLYYLIDGFIKYFIMSYIYVYSGSLLSYAFNGIKKNCYYFIIIYFSLSIVSTLLEYLIGDIAIYLGPHSIMIAGSFLKISSVTMIIVNLLPLIISSILFHRKNNTNYSLGGS